MTLPSIMETPQLTHGDFISLQKTNKATLSFDNQLLAELEEHLPKNVKFAMTFWGIVWFLSFPGIVACIALSHYITAALIFFFITLTMRGSARVECVNGLLARAIEEPNFYKFLLTSKSAQVVFSKS